MTKAELVEELARVANLTRADSEVAVGTIFDGIANALAKGDKVELREFGVFTVRRRRAREGRNPKTGAKVSVPAKTVPFFQASKEMRESLNRIGTVA